MIHDWTRRDWMKCTLISPLAVAGTPLVVWGGRTASHPSLFHSSLEGQAHHSDAAPYDDSSLIAYGDDWAALAKYAVDIAMQAGAQYADARLTRTMRHWYGAGGFFNSFETLGIGVRALVNGSWGFAACPSGDQTEVAQLAQSAVAQATVNARGPRRSTVLADRPIAVGTWMTPVGIDPFTVSIEEKNDFFRYWHNVAAKYKLFFDNLRSEINFVKRECVTAISDGSQFSQTIIESGGRLCVMSEAHSNSDIYIDIAGVAPAGRGWELLLDANIPEQLRDIASAIEEVAALVSAAKIATIGRYTLVCDGATTAALVNGSVGLATQLDRALGYEADAGGTSFLDDPLAMLGSFAVTSPLVTLTANRSTPGHLATVKWDDEGVAPGETTLIKQGVLHDYQTSREQAAWLAPYYTKVGRPVQSNGYAGSDSALAVTLQQMPNLSLTANPSPIQLTDLIANVKDGLLIQRGQLYQIDAQGRNGMFIGRTREIKNGRLGRMVVGGGVQFNALDLWKNITALGGTPTQTVLTSHQYARNESGGFQWQWMRPSKGQPPQETSFSTQSVAATIANQAVINPDRLA